VSDERLVSDERRVSDEEEADIRRFFAGYVETFEDLKVLAWLVEGAARGRATAERVAEETLLPEPVASESLARLVAKGLIASDVGRKTFRYVPVDAALGATLDMALERYRRNPVEIIGFMTANAIDRVKTAALRTFAESFRIRGPRK